MDLKTNSEGIVTGAIYLACKKLYKDISQSYLKKTIGIDEYNISKRAKELNCMSMNENLF